VRIFLASGAQRTIEAADSARLHGAFFIINQWYPDLNRMDTILTFRADDVVAAEIIKDGVVTDCILGTGHSTR
jgi:hypothetical protein